MNLFVLSGYGSESFAAFLNEVILQKKTTRQLLKNFSFVDSDHVIRDSYMPVCQERSSFHKGAPS